MVELSLIIRLAKFQPTGSRNCSPEVELSDRNSRLPPGKTLSYFESKLSARSATSQPEVQPARRSKMTDSYLRFRQ